MYGCRGETVGHCQPLGLDQCEYCEWYEAGHGLPHYPVPAVQYTVRYHDYHACSPRGYIELRDVSRNFMRKRWFPRRTKC